MFKKKIVIAAATAFSSLSPLLLFAGNYADDFGNASKLLSQRKYQEAMESFIKLSVRPPSASAGDSALAKAAECAAVLRKFKEAYELAAKIKSAPDRKFCKMKLLLRDRKANDLIAEFKDEDINAWPDRLVSRAFYERGFAYSAMGNAPKGIQDLEKSLKSAINPLDKINASYLLGSVYMKQKDDEKALAAFAVVETCPKFSGSASFMRAMQDSASILMRQGKYDEAEAKLGKIRKNLSGYWKASVGASYGDLALARGKKQEAIEKYKEALSGKGIPANLASSVQSKIDSMKESNDK